MKISAIINEVCARLNIDYVSKHTNGADWHKDVTKLSQIYLTIKTIMGDLSDIEEKYPGITGLKDIFERAIQELGEIDHQIIDEAITISKKHKKDKEA